MALRLVAIATAAAMLAGPASAATGLQHVVSFEDPADIAGVELTNDMATKFSCLQCAVEVASDPAFPAHSGQHVVRARDFDVTVQDPFNISWPAIGAFVTGGQDVFADFWEYDYNLAQNVQVATVSVPGGTPNAFLGYGFDQPAFLTFVHFHSGADFTLDDLTIGRTDVAPGIPEPSAWTLMLTGFAGLGLALRRRSLVAA